MAKTLHSVIDKVYSLANLRIASSKVCTNKGAAGLDGQSVREWRKQEPRNLSNLRKLLLENRYECKPVKRVYIPKPGSDKKRPLGIPVVGDRCVQQAVAQIIGPAFEDRFFEDSHGFRPKRSTKTAAHRIEELHREGYRHVVDLDIKGFFDNVDHDILLGQVRQVVKDRRVLSLIRSWLKCGVMDEGKLTYLTSGTPQGGVISPLLANIYLTPFDLALKSAGYLHVRYADDVLILCRSREEAESALAVARSLLGRLRLELAEEKTKVTDFKEGFDFLGFRFGSRGRGIGKKSLLGLYQKIREATKRQQGNYPVRSLIAKVNPVVRGWAQYHLEGRNRTLFWKIDEWVRNRLRAYVRGRFRDGPRGRLIFHSDELRRMGLVSIYKMILGSGQLLLF